ncbi:helix-turn-helix domain-containing protein [Escherichia coli]|nr:helix-turn-helix domain-containing protein [Escherichia coli]
MKHKAIEKAIEILGSQQALAKRCGKAQSTVCDWLNCKNKISPEFVPLLVAAVDGKIQAYEFRPDLPELFPHPSLERTGEVKGLYVPELRSDRDAI